MCVYTWLYFDMLPMELNFFVEDSADCVGDAGLDSGPIADVGQSTFLINRCTSSNPRDA